MTETVFLNFHENITIVTANCFMDFCARAIQHYKPKKLYFLFSSNGGAVDSGYTLYNYLRGLPQEIVMHNVGSIDSIANAVFLAGDVRYATSTSMFLLHGITWNFQQPANMAYSQIQEIIGRLDVSEDLTAKIISERTKLTTDEVRELFRQGQSKEPSFALEKEFIHDIREVSIPDGAPLHSIVTTGGFQGYN